jgi:hypothetical protein
MKNEYNLNSIFPHTMSKQASDECPPDAQKHSKLHIIDPQLLSGTTMGDTSVSGCMITPTIPSSFESADNNQEMAPSEQPKTPVPTHQQTGSTLPHIIQNSPTIRALKKVAKQGTARTADITHFFCKVQHVLWRAGGGTVQILQVC